MNWKTFVGIMAFVSMGVSAQNNKDIQLKTNMIFLPIGMLNVGSEFALSSQFSLQGDIFISPWKSIRNHRALFAMGHIEARYYFRKVYDGWYAGANAGAAVFELTKWNYTGSNQFQEGFNFMLGATVGYQWEISNQWGLDFYLGAGTIQSYYHGYDTLAEGYVYRYEISEWNKSGEFLPYRGGVMLTYRLR